MSRIGADTTLAAIASDAAHSAVLLDVDGTLAPIIKNPLDASVPIEVRRTLIELGRRFGLVACISGRTADEARRIVGAGGIVYVGGHGSEVLNPGANAVLIDPALEPWAEQTGAAALRAMRELTPMGIRLEDKGAIAALHWRGAVDEEAAEDALKAVAAEAEAEGLAVHWGRKVLELRPPVPFNKGLAVAELLGNENLRNALYAGDDSTDLDAFETLEQLKTSGKLEHTLRVGVISAEAPPALGQAADELVDGTAGVASLLKRLLEAVQR